MRDLLAPSTLFSANTLKMMIPVQIKRAITICLLSTLFLSEALDRNTAKITTDKRLQQLNRLTVVKEVKIIATLSNSVMQISTSESLINYF